MEELKRTCSNDEICSHSHKVVICCAECDNYEHCVSKHDCACVLLWEIGNYKECKFYI